MTMFRTDDDLSTFTWVEVPEGTAVHCEAEPDAVLLIFRDATAAVQRNLPANFQLSPTLRELKLAGASLSSSQSAAS